MTYSVTIKSSGGKTSTFECGGASDADALIYAGKVVEKEADQDDLDASIVIEKDGQRIGPASTVRDMVRKSV